MSQNIPHIALGLLLALLPLGLYSMSRTGQSQVMGVTTTLSPGEIISISNAYRLAEGLPPLHPQDQLTQAAEAKANAMLAANSWSHNTPTQTPWQFIQGAGYRYAFAGENLAKGFSSSTDVVEGWFNSPSHKANLLNPKYTDIGVAVIEGNFQGNTNTTLVVQFLAEQYDPTTDIAFNQEIVETPLLIRSIAKINPLVFAIGTSLLGLILTATLLILKIRSKTGDTTRIISSKHWKH